MKKTKRILSILVLTAFIFSSISICGAASNSTASATMLVVSAASAADRLHKLGLFQGIGTAADGKPNFDLQRAPTRAEAITMLVRLLGKESEAKNGNWTTPFTDIEDWVAPYVGYAYTHGLTTGTSDTTFDCNSSVTASQYITFILRALGYTSGADFGWNRSWIFSDSLGITNGEYKEDSNSILRGGAAKISFNALQAKNITAGKPLFEILIDNGVFSPATSSTVGLISETKQPPEETPASDTSYDYADIIEVEGISILPTSITLKIAGDSSSRSSSAIRTDIDVKKAIDLTPTIRPSNATNKTVRWSSSNTKIARVSSKGHVTALAKGTATITASTYNGLTATCTLTVNDTVTKPTNLAMYKEFPTIPDFGVNMGNDFFLQSVNKHTVGVGLTYTYDVTRTRSFTLGEYYEMLEELGFTFVPDKTGTGADGYYTNFTHNVSASLSITPAKKLVTIQVTEIAGISTPDSITAPKLNHDYGPFLIVDYVSDTQVANTEIYSLIFTKIDYSSISKKYYVEIRIRGVSNTSRCEFDVLFYNSVGTILGRERLNRNVTSDTPYDFTYSATWDETLFINTAQIDFRGYYSGNPAKYG